MRLLSQSTRTTIRTLTLLFALTSLLLTMMTPFVGTADATLVGSTFDGSDGENIPHPGSMELTDPCPTGNDGDEATAGNDDGPTNENTTKFGVINTDEPPTINTDLNHPGKSDLCKVWINSEVQGEDLFLYLAWEREATTGSTTVFFEFHQAPLACTTITDANRELCNPFNPRTDGDFVLTFDFKGNDATIYKRTWNGTNAEGAFGNAVNLSEIGHAEAKLENGKKRGEAVVNLADAGILSPNSGVCEAVAGVIPGTVTGNSDNADYKDVILSSNQPHISNCGQVIVKKESTTGSFYGDTFDVTLSGDAGSLNRTETLTEVDPSFEANDVFANNDYTVSEAVPDGWTIQSISCDDESSETTGEGVSELTGITVEADDTVICTVTNAPDLPTIELQKTVINDDGGQGAEEDFQASIDNGIGDVDWSTAVPVPPGSYTVFETVEPGYQPGNWGQDCNDAGEVTVALGDDVVCTITNDDQPATLTLEKVLDFEFEGSLTEDDFAPTVEYSPFDGADAPTNSSVPADPTWDTYTVPAGSYSVGEELPLPFGYQLVDVNCGGAVDATEASFDLNNGESITCTITNKDLPAGLTVTKVVDNDWGGTLEPGDFTLTVTPLDPDTLLPIGEPFEVASGEASESLPAGTYRITETQQEGYELQGVTCTVDQVDQQVPDSTSVVVTVDNGETGQCTFTNGDLPASLTLAKDVANDNGGTATEDDFDPSLVFNNDDGGMIATGNEPDTDTPTWTTYDEVPTGEYTIGEAVVEAGYDLTDVSCYASSDMTNGEPNEGAVTLDSGAESATVNLAHEDDVTCIVTNDDIGSQLTLVKEVITNDGGTATDQDFMPTLGYEPLDNPEGVQISSTMTPDAWGTHDVDAGIYTIGEMMLVDGYLLQGIECSRGEETFATSDVNELEIEIGLDDDVTCTITNDDVPAGLTIVKEVVNDDEGTLGAGDFPLEITPEGGETEVVDSGAVTTVPAGTYTIGEQQQEDYELVSIVCDNGVEAAEGEDTVTVTVANGESVICTITNDDVPPVVIVGEILGSVEPVCDADAAYLNYEASTVNVDSETVTIHWFDADGVEQHTDVVEGLSGQVLWPGAEVDEDGFATDWPGFVFDGEVWEEGDDGFGWANGAVTVTLEVNPTTEPLTATYPSDADAAAGEDCLPPEIEVAGQQFEQPAPELPRTGLETGRMALWAALLAGLGALILLATDTPTATVRQRR